jgi:hypothetical protein
MKPSKLFQLLLKLVAAHKPVLIKGRPGVGKSDIAAQVAEKLGLALVTWHPITSDPVDFKGFPYMTDKKGKRSADFAPYGDLEAVVHPSGPTLCLIDDLGQAAPAVQAAVMHPLLARQINGHKISDDVTFLACTNRREDRAAVTGLIAPLVDRMVAVFELEPDPEDWIRWGLDAGVPPALLAFVRFRPNFITEYTPNRDIVKVTTPRTLYEVGEMLKLGLDDAEALAGAAGQAFATEFLAFYRVFADLPAATEVISNPNGAPVPSNDRPDVLFALMGSLAHASSLDNFDAITRYLDRLPPEYAVLCVKDATARNRALLASAGYTRFVTTHQALYGLSGS